jgi:hypothetical protein
VEKGLAKLSPGLSPGFRIAAFVDRWGLWLYLITLVTLCLIQVALGALPTRIYAHDFFIVLDGAWRLANGQTPNVDFYAGYGVWVFNPIRWAFAIYGYNADAIGLVRAFYTAVIGVWFLMLSRIEPRRIPSMVLGFFLLAFLSASRPLGEYPTWVSHAMFYNRVGYALLFLIVFEQLSAFRFEVDDRGYGDPSQGSVQFWRGISTGTALACLVLVKISFVAPGAALLATGFLLFGINRRHFIGMWAGGLAMLLFAMACLHFRPLPFLQETLTLSHQRSNIAGEAMNIFVNDLGEVLLLLTAGTAVAAAGLTNRRMARKYILATVVIAGCDVFGRATNAMRSDLPLAAWWGLSGAMLLLFVPVTAQAKTARLRYMIALLVVCPLAIPIFLKDCSSSAYAMVKTVAKRNDPSPRFDSPSLRDWVPQDWQGDEVFDVNSNGKPLILATNDGIHLLQRFSRQDETVFAIAFDNPFSFALGRKPAEGGALWLHFGNNVSVEHPVPESTIIGRPDLLMVRHADGGEDITRKVLTDYPDLLDKQFSVVGSSEYWTLYRRRP